MSCECPKLGRGEHVTLAIGKCYPLRDCNDSEYRILDEENTQESSDVLADVHVHKGFNAFRHIPCTVSELPKPDLLHTMQLGMLDHLHKWLFHFMKTHNRLDRYNALSTLRQYLQPEIIRIRLSLRDEAQASIRMSSSLQVPVSFAQVPHHLLLYYQLQISRHSRRGNR